MKSPTYTMSKVLIVSGIILLIIIILKDLSSIYFLRQEKEKLDYYIDFERENIVQNQQSISAFIDILIQFKDAENQETYLPFLKSTSKSLEDLEKLSRWYLEYEDNFTSKNISRAIENLNTKVSSIQNPKIIDFYLLLAKTQMLTLINHEMIGSSSGGLNMISIVKPFNQDSAYIGRKVITDKLSKLTFQINEQEGISYKNKYNTFSIPKSDTINIITTHIEAEFNHVDTFTHHQTIAHINGEWKYIGSD